MRTPAWTTTTVPFTTASDGSATVTGYQHDWNPALYRGYSESIRVTVRSATNNGIVLEGLTATCAHGWSGTVAVDCDPQAGTLTARVEATGLPQVAPDDQHVVTYTRTLNYRVIDSLGFQTTTNPVTVRMPAPTDGYSTAPLYSETPARDTFSSYRERIHYRVVHRNYGGFTYYTVAEGEVACRLIG